MATLTIRNVDERVKRKLQIRAAYNGRSMEAEVRALLEALEENVLEAQARQITNMRQELKGGLGNALTRLFTPLNENDLD
jgi:plasmid stability protein